jgi:hypothetical protein
MDAITQYSVYYTIWAVSTPSESTEKTLEAFEIIFAPPLVPLSGVRSTRYGVGTPDFSSPWVNSPRQWGPTP